MATIKLGDLLVRANVLQESQLKAALAEQQKWGGRLGEILVRMSLVTEDLLVRALSRQLGIPAVNLEGIQGIPPHVKAKIPLELARELAVVPLQLRDDNKTLVVAMAEPQHVEHMDHIRAISKCRIAPQLAGQSSISRAIARFYEGESELSDADGSSSFKVVDAQGRTLVKSIKEIEQEARAAQPAPAPPPRRPTPPPEAPAARRAGPGPVELLRTVEEVQRKEVAALKAMVELLIERGVFTREEYLAKVKR
jgi:hypothetical protein